jgi:hypothetical protein
MTTNRIESNKKIGKVNQKKVINTNKILHN